MESVSNYLNKTVISFGNGTGLTVLQIVIALLTLLIGLWLARWSERKLSRRLERREVDAGVVQLIRRLFYILVIVVLVITTLDLLGIPQPRAMTGESLLESSTAPVGESDVSCLDRS